MQHYFTNNNYNNDEKHKYKINISGQQFIFNTTKGVFSKEGLDYGSRILLETLIKRDISGSVLDVGCGYGPIGIVIGRFKDVQLHMIDVNRSALDLATLNARINNITKVKIYESYNYSKVDQAFNYIITNPPIRAGKKVVYEIIEGAKNYLKQDGELWIVIRKAQGAKSLIKDMASIYNIDIVNKESGYYILRCKTIN